MSKLARWEGDQFVVGDEFERDGRKPGSLLRRHARFFYALLRRASMKMNPEGVKAYVNDSRRQMIEAEPDTDSARYHYADECQ